MRMTPLAIAMMLTWGASASAFAADTSELTLLKQQMEALQNQMQVLQNKLGTMAAAPQPSTTTSASSESPLSTKIGGVDATLYGNIDVSTDVVNDGKESISQVSSNLSYFGIRGGRDLGSSGYRAIYQIETLVNVSGTPTETGALGSRNSFVGVQGNFGKLMLGKTDTPYKRATAAMDPFSASVGDYNSIMGNTGGDLRAEFDARLPHSIFYDSPKLGGFSVNALVSPGQKLGNLAGSDKYAFAQGEKVCSGATPGSSGALPDPGSPICNDGAFSTAYSVALNYESGPWLGTFAYERHGAVDRTSDTGGVVSDESAAKIGMTYRFKSNRLSAIYEKLYRNGGGVDPTLDERQRNGVYVSDVQELGNHTDLMVAWAHAGQTPGSPDFGTLDNTANMYSVGLKYHYDKMTSMYVVGSVLSQGEGGHYALGASGHGVAIAAPRDDTGATIGGKTLNAISVGMQHVF